MELAICRKQWDNYSMWPILMTGDYSNSTVWLLLGLGMSDFFYFFFLPPLLVPVLLRIGAVFSIMVACWIMHCMEGVFWELLAISVWSCWFCVCRNDSLLWDTFCFMEKSRDWFVLRLSCKGRLEPWRQVGGSCLQRQMVLDQLAAES